MGALGSDGVTFSAVIEMNSTLEESSLDAAEVLECIRAWKDKGQTVNLASQILVVDRECVIDAPVPCAPSPSDSLCISPLLFGGSMGGLLLAFLMLSLSAILIAAACGRCINLI